MKTKMMEMKKTKVRKLPTSIIMNSIGKESKKNLIKCICSYTRNSALLGKFGSDLNMTHHYQPVVNFRNCYIAKGLSIH